MRDKDGRFTNPIFITMTGGSFGWQWGVQNTDIVLVFTTPKGIEGITGGKVTLGADASVAAGPVGRQASAATDPNFKAEVYSYSRSRGVFAGLALDGTVVSIDDDANESFYNKSGVNASDIIAARSRATTTLRDASVLRSAPAPAASSRLPPHPWHMRLRQHRHRPLQHNTRAAPLRLFRSRINIRVATRSKRQGRARCAPRQRSHRMSLAVAVIAPGNMGAAVGKRLTERSVEVLTTLSERSKASYERATAAGMRAAPWRN